MTEHFSGKYWDQRYLTNEIQWDIGSVSTPLQAYIDQLKDRTIKILIPGCGNAYEAYYLNEKGFKNITLVDISTVVTNKLIGTLQDKQINTIKIINEDFFKIDEQYDLVLEQTFFCALDPSLRHRYAEKMYSILKSDGLLAGVLFNRQFEGGPPFGGNISEYRKLFAPLFKIKTLEPCYNSILPRRDSEAFIILQKT